MEIIFYKKDTGEEITDTDDYFFIMNNEVYSDNGSIYESQAEAIGFEDCIESRTDLGWRVRL